MANNCADGVYNLHYTDNSKNPITVNKKTLVQDIIDIILLGKSRKEYGEVFNENMLHLLENFSCQEDVANPGNPDLNKTHSNLLENPIEGQLWYNSTKQKLYSFDGIKWNGLGVASDIGGNSGIIAHGNQLPRPISPITGYEFPYDECSWIVSPFNFPYEVDYMVCYSDSTSKVTSQYRLSENGGIVNGYAFYQIIGIKYNNNEGDDTPVVPPVPTMTPQPGISLSPTPTRGATATPTPTVTPTRTVTPSFTRTATPSPTRTVTPSKTKAISPTPTHTPPVSIKPLKATLYIAPSVGYPVGTTTAIPQCVTTNTSDDACYSTLSIVVQGLSGGTAPYKVDFSGIIFNSAIVVIDDPNVNVNSTLTYSYSGASGTSTSAIRTGATTTSTLKMDAKISIASGSVRCNRATWQIGVGATSHVVITDALGKTLTLYTPAGSNGNVQGSTATTSQGAYIDTWSSSPNCGGGGGGCVTTDAFLLDGKLAGEVNVDDTIITNDPYNYFNEGTDTVSYSVKKTQPCVRIVTESGASLVCSTTAPIPTLGNGYMLAPSLLGRMIPVMRDQIINWEAVTTVTPVGDREIQHISIGDQCFWAGETPDAFILHHNKAPTKTGPEILD